MTDFAALDRTISSIDPIDVARPELFAEDRWQEPFRRLRAEAPIQYVPQSKFGPYWSVTTYKPIVHIKSLPKIFDPAACRLRSNQKPISVPILP